MQSFEIFNKKKKIVQKLTFEKRGKILLSLQRESFEDKCFSCFSYQLKHQNHVNPNLFLKSPTHLRN